MKAVIVGIKNSAPVMMPRLAMIDSTQASAAPDRVRRKAGGLLGPGRAARRQRLKSG